MKESEYITWVKAHHDVRYNLARSGAPPYPLSRLDLAVDDLLKTGFHEEGWPPLLERIATRYGVAPSQVVLTHGATMANHLACAALLEPGDDVLVERPGYEPLRALPAYLRARVRRFGRAPSREYALSPEAIEKCLTPGTRLVILSNLHNPSGVEARREDLCALGALAEARDFHVLVDEVYLEFKQEQETAATLSPRFVTTRSLTKAFGLDSLRLGWVLASPEWAERMRRLNDLFSIKTAHPSERIAACVLDRAETLIAPTRQLLRRNAELVDAFIGEQPRLSWTRPEAGTVGFVRLAGGSVEALAEKLETAFDTAIAPGHFFEAPQCFRIGFSMETATLKEALRRLAEGLLHSGHRSAAGRNVANASQPGA